MKLETIEDVLDVAIEAEVRAATSYASLAERTGRDDLRTLLLSMAAEEASHREALERVRDGDLTLFAGEGPPNDVLWAPSAEPKLDTSSSPASALLAAIDSERRSFTLYSGLAEATTDPGLKTILGALAREEAKHWHDLEVAYEQMLAAETE